jgi:predicted  nucleic acid-binding Zn-ribbon protein
MEEQILTLIIGFYGTMGVAVLAILATLWIHHNRQSKDVGMVQGHIEQMNRRFDDANGHMGRLDRGVTLLGDKIDRLSAQMDSKMDGLENRLSAQMDSKMDGLENRLSAQMDSKIDRLENKMDSKIDRLDSKIDGLSAQMDGKIDGLGVQVDGKIDGLGVQVDGRIVRLDNKVDRLGIQMDEKIDRLKEDVREEMRRNTDRIMLALINHSHADGSPPVFTAPPEVEATAADD